MNTRYLTNFPGTSTGDSEVQQGLFDAIDSMDTQPGQSPNNARVETFWLSSENCNTERSLFVVGGLALGTIERCYAFDDRTRLTAVNWQASVQFACAINETAFNKNTALHATDDLAALVEAWMAFGHGALVRMLQDPLPLVSENLAENQEVCSTRVLGDGVTLHVQVLSRLVVSNDVAELIVSFADLEPEERWPFVQAIVTETGASAYLWRTTPLYHRGTVPLILALGLLSRSSLALHSKERVSELIRRMRHLPLAMSARICLLAGWPKLCFIEELIGAYLPLMRHWWARHRAQPDQGLDALASALELLRRARLLQRLSSATVVVSYANFLLDLTVGERTAFDIGYDRILAYAGIEGDAHGVSVSKLALKLHRQALNVATCQSSGADDTHQDEDLLPSIAPLKQSAMCRVYDVVSYRFGITHPLSASVGRGATISWRCHIASNLPEWKMTIGEHVTLAQQRFSVLPLNDLRLLAEEGCAMQHCVLDYWTDAIEGQFRAFSLRRRGKRLATLGIWRSSRNEGRWELHECSGRQNAKVADDRMLALLIDIVLGFYNYFSESMVD